MRDYCNEIVKKEKFHIACILIISFLISSSVLALSILKMMKTGFDKELFIVVAVMGMIFIGLIVILLRKPFKEGNLGFVKNILKQQLNSEEYRSISNVFNEINSDLNINGQIVGSFLIGDKWMLAKSREESVPQAVNLTFLLGFASGNITSNRNKHRRVHQAIVLVTDKMGDVTFYCSESQQQQLYVYLKNRFPHLAGNENIDLGRWLIEKFVTNWRGRI